MSNQTITLLLLGTIALPLAITPLPAQSTPQPTIALEQVKDNRKQECNSIIKIHNAVVAQSTAIFKQKSQNTSVYKKQMQKVARIYQQAALEMASVPTKDEQLKTHRNRFASMYRDAAKVVNQIIPMISKQNRQQQIAKKLVELSDTTKVETELVNEINSYCSQF
jgi:L-amino acid N-acyltransferase YncA